MSDHFSGPRALADPAADITDVYAFPSPERPGHLVLVMNVLPLAAATALFSDALSYRFRVRPVTSVTAGPAFEVGAEEHAFDVTFTAPVPGNGTGTIAQYGTCTAPGGRQVCVRVGDENPAEVDGLRVFAGPRLDPFFIDFARHIATVTQEKLAFRPAEGVNALEGQNVLSIVVEFDTAAFCPGAGPLLAAVAETVTRGEPSARLERMGRPEIKNFTMQPKQFDTVNRDLEIRDLYNADDAFSVSPDYVGAYRARLSANLAFFDRLDGKVDWPLDSQGNHPLTELWLADFLVVDMSKPFSDEGYLEIETALLAGREHTTCGGRSLNHDMVDTYYTLMVGGVDGPRISDGVDQTTRPATRTFPYLVSPNPNPPELDLLGAIAAAQSAPPEEAAAS
jgi:Domain of unknown function (DUF4331)